MRHFKPFTPNDFVSAFPLAPGFRDRADGSAAAAASDGSAQRDAMARRLFYASNSEYDFLRFYGKGDGPSAVLSGGNQSSSTAAASPTSVTPTVMAAGATVTLGATAGPSPSELAIRDPRQGRASPSDFISDLRREGRDASRAARGYEGTEATTRTPSLPPHNASLVWPTGFSWERKREPFLMSVIHYLAFLASRPELELHVICTASFDADWRR